jgi:alpha-tubulin suppressor-like RCC1 family protein
VIVIIGILAAITIVSYIGISQRAVSASLQADLDSVSRQLKLFQVTNGLYPATIDCSQPDSTTNKCLKTSGGNSYTIYSPNNSSPQSFSLTETNTDGITYRITDGSLPTIVNFYNWSNIAAGNEHGCALTSDGKVYCWGYNGYGGLGNGNNTNSNIPVAVSTSGVLSGKTVKAISNGGSYTCVIASDNQIYCWGLNSGYGSGELGNNSTTDSYIPVAVNISGVLSGKTIKSISVETNSCVIASDNQAYCWGANVNGGQLGNNSIYDTPTPVAVNTSGVLNGLTMKYISVGSGTNVCAIASDNQVYCWGQQQ